MICYTCPVCSRVLEVQAREEAPHRPFCSRRCRLIDLGRWFNEEYHVSESMTGSMRDVTPPDARDGTPEY